MAALIANAEQPRVSTNSKMGFTLLVAGMALLAAAQLTSASPSTELVVSSMKANVASRTSLGHPIPMRTTNKLSASYLPAEPFPTLQSQPQAAGHLPATDRFASAMLRSLWAVPLVLLGSWAVGSKNGHIAMASTTGQVTEQVDNDSDYIFATTLEEIPKGTRKLLNLKGANILVFWYRNELYAIENRSPAEGAFNQGFEQARFTQDFGILCPSTETEFNLKTGAVVNWMPNNSVLRFLTPPCPPLEVFPVKVEGDEVRVKVVAEERSYFDGGARSSFERNNVFGIEPRMYLDDGTYVDEMGNTQKAAINPTTLIITTIAVAIIAVAGTATCLYFESIPALAVFWLVLFGITAKVILDYTNDESDASP